MTQPSPDDPSSSAPPPGDGSGRGGSGPGRGIALFAILSLFWFLLSGRFGLRYLVFMVSAVGLVLALNPERPFASRGKAPAAGLQGRLRATGHLVRFVGWLVWEVMRANVDVAFRILHPRLPIRPRLMRFRTGLRSEVGQVLLANSITLTPGTVTIDMEEGEYLVHALHPETTQLLLTAELQNAIGPIFGDDPVSPPEVEWSSSYRDLHA